MAHSQLLTWDHPIMLAVFLNPGPALLSVASPPQTPPSCGGVYVECLLQQAIGALGNV